MSSTNNNESTYQVQTRQMRRNIYMNQSNIQNQPSQSSSESIDDMMGNLSLRDNGSQKVQSDMKTQEKQNLTRYQRARRREANPMPLRRNLPKKTTADLYIPQSLRAITYSYLPYQMQFLKIRLLSNSERQILSYVQTLEGTPEVIIKIDKKKLPSKLNINSLWEFCGNPLIVFDNYETYCENYDQNSLNSKKILKRFALKKEQTFYHNLKQIIKMKSQSGKSIEKQCLYFEIICWGKLPFKDDSWLNLSSKFNIDFKIENLVLDITSSLTLASLENFGNLLSISQEIHLKSQDVLLYWHYENQDLQNFLTLIIEEKQFECQILKISASIMMKQDYFKYLQNLKELQIFDSLLSTKSDFHSVNNFPKNIQKLVCVNAIYLKQQDQQYLELSFLNGILQRQNTFEKLEQIEICPEDISLVAEHCDRLKSLWLLVIRNVDEQFKILDHMKEYQADFSKLMKERRMTIEIIEDVKKYFTPEIKTIDFGIYIGDCIELINKSLCHEVPYEQYLEENTFYLIKKPLKPNSSRKYRFGSYVSQIYVAAERANQHSRIDLILTRDINKFQTIMD
eukprot:403365201